MSNLKKIEDLKDFAKYSADLKSSIARVGKVPAAVLYVKRFQFATKAAPLALVGPVDATLKSGLVAQKVEMKLGKVVRRDDGKLVLDVVNAFHIQEVLKAAAVPAEVDANGDFKNTGFGGASDKLDKHLVTSGRDISDQKKREEVAGKILQGMEDTTNARKKELTPGKAPAHHVSAHGPGTDQITRLVSGRRTDEIDEEVSSGKAPTTKVKLTGNPHGVPDTEMPAYDKVGQNPSNVAGSFTSNVGMLQAIEEAYAQVSRLDSHLEGVLKQAFDKKYEDTLKIPEVAAALENVKKARTVAQNVHRQLKQPGIAVSVARKLTEDVKVLEKKANALADEFQKQFKAHGGADPVARPVDVEVGDKRVVRNVAPGSPTKEGIGQGVVIPSTSPVGTQKAKAPIAPSDGSKTDEEVMQERFREIKPTAPQQQAAVVMDPAFVKDPKTGKPRRAGWDVQTAYPNDDPAQKKMEDPGVAEEFVKLSKVVSTLEKELEAARSQKNGALSKYEAAKKKVESQEGAIKSKKDKALPALEKALLHAKPEKVVEAQKKVDDMKLAIKALEDDLPALKLDAQNEKVAGDLVFNAASLEVTRLEGELEVAKKAVDDASKA